MPVVLGASDSINDLIRAAKQRPIDSAAANVEVIPARPAKRFAVIHLMIEAEAATDLTFNSDTDAISGPFAMASNETLELKNGGAPVAVGGSVNESFNIDNSGTAQLNGFVVYAMIDTVPS